MQDEAGASDNRLSIDPSAFNGVAKDWEDGKTYDVTLKVTQVSPGEFTVDDLQASAAEESGESNTDQTASDTGEAEAYPANRAVSKLMASK